MEETAGKTRFTRWAGVLWPIGGTLVGLIGMPLFIDQYPNFFHRNTSMLPLCALVVFACWIIPFAVHSIPRQLYGAIKSVRKIGVVLAPSIDEYGPFAIKKKGGRKRVRPGECYAIPQWQKSKGWLIVTAALELSKNRVTHFYSRKKNTEEMIRMADLLRSEYRSYKRLYLSWDAASWHISKKLKAHLEKLNGDREDAFPVVETAPLPASAQFLNIIESVFSGMARAIIHNSDYPSVEAAVSAIDRYFQERNAHFAIQPSRAGHKIWRLERAACEFSESNNCKDPSYR